MQAYQKEKGPYTRPPGPTLNGGLYTGEPFREGAPWGNTPVTPDAGHVAGFAMQRMTDPPPPPGAQHQFPGGGWRPGNNTPFLPAGAAERRFPDLDMTCTPEVKRGPNPQGFDGFQGFAYSGMSRNT